MFTWRCIHDGIFLFTYFYTVILAAAAESSKQVVHDKQCRGKKNNICIIVARVHIHMYEVTTHWVYKPVAFLHP